tara:strand:+ start:636 stop:1058 length:423 start_codon:yes stop_codon:yes gene_type:complete
MKSSLIVSKQLKIIKNNEGDILHGIKSSDHEFTSFGEAYFSKVKFKKIKAWKKHLRMTCNLIVPIGEVHFVCVDSSLKYFSETIGEENYKRLTIPPGIWFGFIGLTDPFSLILNLADIEHDANEMKKINSDKIKYDWSIY